MQIKEKSVIGKHPKPEKCEDGIVVTDSYVAVIDGSTSKTSFQWQPPADNGRTAMLLLSSFIEQANKDYTCEEFCQDATHHIFRYYEQHGDTESCRKWPERRLTASLAVYSHYWKQVWLIGDCTCIVGHRIYDNVKPAEQAIACYRASLIQQGMSPQKARQQIVPMLIEEMYRSQNLNYAVIDGFPVYQKGVKIIYAPEEDIVLASDGYPFLHETLRDSEQALQHQLQTDPQNIHLFKATKGLCQGYSSFDDRAYIRFTDTEKKQ